MRRLHRRIGCRVLLTLCLALAGLPGSARGENWPQWRGPFFNGSTTEVNLPDSWDRETGKNIAWTTPLPGPSGSTPIVWGDRIFISSLDVSTKGLVAMCIDGRDGKVLWRCAVGKDRAIPRNNMASPSPVADGQARRVYFTYGTGEIFAFAFDGKEIWRKDLEKEQGKIAILFGYSNTPLLWEGKLYVLVMQRSHAIVPDQADPRDPKSSYLLAVDPATGKDLWKHIRPTDARDEAQEAYTTPMPYVGPAGEKQVILYGGDYLTGHDPQTGKELWRWRGYNLEHVNHWRVVTSPVVTPDLIYVSGPKKEPFFAIRTGAHGDVAEGQVAWTFKTYSTDAASPLLYKGRLYILDGDKRMMTCLDPKTGKQIWQGKMADSDVWRGSPMGADDKIYCMSERGEVVVLATDQFKVLFRTNMSGPYARSTIVAANGQLLIRSAKALYCIRK